ncbi:unnamed protein product [Tilletia laevis]|uniref:Mitochondrial dicarboxylate transporter n=2 Tax=Tilletia TaxID=13289 RepID=A0A177UME2_9BASI|nr:hypothetical protein CF336_g4987 [Tilletia laevis]KAE8257504.1 hypothetical protein A4X03_0g4647 [Tilletia caries]CAD6898406.1 unnamed protein product [Tilletia controversa]KAE8196932.1 hypothetical protein CF335_g4735 [Tilletia laevis]CAD6886190.1 unnamed protein product [Tilletia caries]
MAATAPLPVVAPAQTGGKAKYPFWLGGLAASCAASITHPLDLTKYRLQTATVRQSMFTTMVTSARTEGITTLWHGITATWLRQFLYSLTRFAVYEDVKARLTPPGSKPTTATLATSAALAGGIAGVVGNPAEIVLVRMCSDLNRAPAARFNYANSVSGLLKITRTEGMGTLFLGLGPNVVRSVVMNVAQLGSYDLFKSLLQSTGMQEGSALTFAASFAAGTTATTLCAPVDVIKSRVQNSSSGEGVLSVIRSSVKQDGLKVFFRGWTPAWIRLQPQTTLIYFFLTYFQGVIDRQRAAQIKKTDAQTLIG